jgi:hypothetical protein
VVKCVFGSKTEGRRKVGRPRLRCLEDAENDLREQGTASSENLVSLYQTARRHIQKTVVLILTAMGT